MNILGAIGVPSERGAVEAKFLDFVEERISIDSEGRKVSGMSGTVDSGNADDPFNIDVQKDFRSKAPASELTFPLFACNKEGQRPLCGACSGQRPLGPNLGICGLGI